MNIGDFINFHEQNTAWLGGVCCKVTNYVLISEFVKKQGVKCYYPNTNIDWVLRPTGSSRSATLELGINFYPHSEFNPYFPSLSREKAIENNTPTKAFWKRFFFFWISDATKTAESTSARRKSLTVSVCSLNDLITSLQFDDDVVGCKSPHSRLMCSSSRPMFPPCSLSCGSWYVFFFFLL